jgi:hypothetical protein
MKETSLRHNFDGLPLRHISFNATHLSAKASPADFGPAPGHAFCAAGSVSRS